MSLPPAEGRVSEIMNNQTTKKTGIGLVLLAFTALMTAPSATADVIFSGESPTHALCSVATNGPPIPGHVVEAGGGRLWCVLTVGPCNPLEIFVNGVLVHSHGVPINSVHRDLVRISPGDVVTTTCN
jgi:hypothetical protein